MCPQTKKIYLQLSWISLEKKIKKKGREVITIEATEEC